MKKFMYVLMAAAMLMPVACSKDEETTEETTLKGRWEAPRYADTPEDVAFVAIFGDESLDLYVISWGQHLTGTYTWSNGVVKFNITEAYQAYTDVEFDETGEMTSWSWMAGNLDASTLTLSNGYAWYPMKDEDLADARTDFGEFEFNVSGTSATSSLVGIDNLTFNKVN